MIREDRASNAFDGLPKWVKIIAVVGLPSVLALGLTYINETRFYDKLNTAQSNTEKILFDMNRQEESLKDLITVLNANNEELRKGNKTTERLMRLTCSGVVDSETKRACWKEE